MKKSLYIYRISFFNKQGWATTTLIMRAYSLDEAIYEASIEAGLNIVANTQLLARCK